MTAFGITRTPKGRFFVTRLADGSKVSGTFQREISAEDRRDKLTALAARKMRNCMCCEKTFLSDGIGHRMCGKCGRHGFAGDGTW